MKAERPINPAVDWLRFRRNCQLVHGLGARALYELLSELAQKTGAREAVYRVTAQYAAIDPIALRVAGGDRFPPIVFATTGADGGR